MSAARIKIILFGMSLYLTIVACNLGTGAPGNQAPPHAVPAVTHTLMPVNLPAKRANEASDPDSSLTAWDRQAPSGDRFTFGEYERPFNANTMDIYYPNFDIIDTQVFQDDTWIYASISMKGRPDVKGSFYGSYAMELDTDVDGKGDWLVLATNPASKAWSTDGVQVWEDKNNDVGGLKPTISETNLASNDGYEFLAFGNGTGDDPDAAWSRISPDDPNTIELAVKRTVVGAGDNFMIGMWAGAKLEPSKYDFNDHMTHTEAGAASKGYEVYYPIKGLAQMDGSCRMPVGFVPTGNEPGLCTVFQPKQPGQPPAGCSLTDAICKSQGQSLDATNCQCVGKP